MSRVFTIRTVTEYILTESVGEKVWNKKKKIWSKGIYKKKMLAEKNANMNNHS